MLRNETPDRLNAQLDISAPKGLKVRIRRTGYVPIPHHNIPLAENPLDRDGIGHIPGYVPDPLFEESKAQLPSLETHAFFVTVIPARSAQPGEYTLPVSITIENRKPILKSVTIRLHGIKLNPLKNFRITQWFYADSLIDWYKTELFDKRFWNIAEKYFRNMTSHGQDTLYVPVFTPPLDGVKRPTQLLRVNRKGKETYSFDWKDVKRYITLAKKAGFRYFEWSHPFTQWGVKYAIRIYENQGKDKKLLWPPSTGAASITYRNFLSQFLPSLKKFCEKEGILKNSFFHVSDEPHGEAHLANYRKARALLSELAPWMKVMDALSDIEYGRKGLSDIPVPSISTALSFLKEDIPSWCYYCCHPRGTYLNRLMDTPLAKIAMHGILFYRWPFQGFLHWGYNYWYESQTTDLIDPFTESAGNTWNKGWAYGDPFMVYPGPDGPIDSIRWEIFGQSLQDFRLLQTLGIKRDDPFLKPVKSFSDFPKDETWRLNLRKRLFSRLP